MEKSKIYTKSGDKGFTSLVGGKRVAKTHLRLEAYGTIDELNSFIACLAEEPEVEGEDLKILKRIQFTLFSVGAYLASEDIEFDSGIKESDVLSLEEEMDRIDAVLPPLKHFILPGGCKSAALAHVCRTVARRAERNIYHLAETTEISDPVLRYINRLSDYFFLLSRKLCFFTNNAEIFWDNTCE